MIPEAALADLRARNPVTTVAGKWVALRKSTRKKWQMVGPCPIHSKDRMAKDSVSFECDAERWICAACCKSGDVIALVMEVEGKDFRGAVEWLGGAQQVDPAVEERRAREAAEKQRRHDEATNRYREEERKRLYDWWCHAAPIAGTPVEEYHARRGILAPPAARLRFRVMPYLEPGGKDEQGRRVWRTLHSGPAQLAAITAPEGHFIGLHITWIDLSQPKGKAVIIHPDTGEVLPAKKMRGTKQGGQIELLRCASPRCLVIGEGIETVLSVYAAMQRLGRPLDGIAFWAAGDLGNLAGAALAGCTERHPTLKDAAGRMRRVPGAEPNFASKAVTIPDSVTDLRLLADGDSDPFATRLAMQRAEARHTRAGRRITTAWPEPGFDFNAMHMPAEVA